MDFADLIGAARIIEYALGRSGLAGIDVGHDADIAIAIEGRCPGHGEDSCYQR
jgi:hypothetical protein